MPATQAGGGYRLPRTIVARLSAATNDLRNAEAVMALAQFLARFHAAPNVLGRAFNVDRVALAAHGGLDLSEARIRGALQALEAIGFVIREVMPGSAYRATEHGLRRRPVLFRFAPDFMAAFQKANAAAQRARGAGSAARRPLAPPAPSRPPESPPVARPAPVLTRKDYPTVGVLSGERVTAESGSGLEAALARLRVAVERGAA